MAEAKQESESQSSFTIEISVKEEKLWMKVTDKKSKKIFESSFTSKQLLSCGFNEAQAGNLNVLHRFIETAKTNEDGLKLNISIEQQTGNDNDNDDYKRDNELEEGVGVQGVYITAAAPSQPKQPRVKIVNYAQIVIIKEDNFFGSMRFIMKLKEIERNEMEINKEIMDDIKNEINIINNKLAVSQQENKSLTTNIDKLGQDLRNEMKDNKEENDHKLDEIKEEIDDKLVDVKKKNEVFVNEEVVKMKEVMVKNKEEINNKLEVDINKLMEEMNKMRHDLNAINDNKQKIDSLKSENVGLKKEIETLKQHQIPKGSVIEWNGRNKDIPIGYILYKDEEENKMDNDDNKIFVHKNDFDKNGIIYFIATNNNTQKWQNPSKNNLIKLETANSMHSGTIHDIINHQSGVECYVLNKKNNWFSIDFKNIQIKPTQYTLRHGYDNDRYSLRWWTFSGSNDKKEWITLKEHKNDKSLNKGYATKTWNIDNCNNYYRYFKIEMNKVNSTYGWDLHCSGFEIYGEMINGKESKSKSSSSPSSSSSKIVTKIIKIV